MIDSKAELGENAGMDEQDQSELAEWQQRAEKAEAQTAAYRKALEDILDAARDPWGMKQHTIAGICNEALGNGKP